MGNHNIDVLRQLRDILGASRDAYLVTVLETWGASPRPVGSVMVYDPSLDQVFGSVSGGCVEDDLLTKLKKGGGPSSAGSNNAVVETHIGEAHVVGAPVVEIYGASTGYSLPCGAQLKLLIEKFSPEVIAEATSKNRSECKIERESLELEQASFSNIGHIQALVAGLETHQTCRRVINLNSRQPLSLELIEPNGFESSAPQVSEHNNLLSITYPAPLQLLIVGAGDVASYLVPLAQQIGYQVCICEPRVDVNQRVVLEDVVSHHVEYIKDRLPDDVVLARYMGKNCAVVALAHDPRVDDLALIAALRGDAHFVGALGSKRNAELRYQRLQTLGVTATELKQLHAPIGLNIGSRTPPEIAISIAAQLLEHKAHRSKASLQVSRVAKNKSSVDNGCHAYHA